MEEKNIVYNFDVTDPKELLEIIWKFSNQIRDLEEKVEYLESQINK